MFIGPVVGILGQKYGVRPVTMVGAITGALSAGICFYAQDMVWITVLWGGICGKYCFKKFKIFHQETFCNINNYISAPIFRISSSTNNDIKSSCDRTTLQKI